MIKKNYTNYKKLILLCTVLMQACPSFAMEPQKIASMPVDIQMVASNNTLFIMTSLIVKLPSPPHQDLSTYVIKNNQAEYEDVAMLSMKNYPTITHIATNWDGNLALADKNGTIYYFPTHADLNKSITETIQLPKAHNSPILRLYMDDNFIVSGSDYPTIKMWQINTTFSDDAKVRKDNTKPVFEQKHAYLFGYEKGRLLYGDWRWKDRLRPRLWGRTGLRELNVVYKDSFKSEGNKLINPIKFDLLEVSPCEVLVRLPTEPSPFSKLPKWAYDHNSTSSTTFFAIELINFNANAVTVYARSMSSLAMIHEIADVTSFDLKTLHIITIDSISHLIIVSDHDIKTTPIGQGLKKNNWRKLQSIEKEKFDFRTASIQASALSGNTLFLAVKKTENNTSTLWLDTIDLKTAISKQEVHKKD
jgi:hypothetical protein